MIEEGQSAPTFSLPSDSGEVVSLESLRGKPIVLYFYPKDESRATKYSNDPPPRVRPKPDAPTPVNGNRARQP